MNSSDPQENNQISELNKKIEELTYQLKRAEATISSKVVDLDKEVYSKYNRDIKGRLGFINKLLDFHKLSDEVTGKVPKKKPLNFF